MSSTDHINGENQTLEKYLEVRTTRDTAFADWVKEYRLAPAILADESDWDDAYNVWMDKIEQAAFPEVDYTFEFHTNGEDE